MQIKNKITLKSVLSAGVMCYFLVLIGAVCQPVLADNEQQMIHQQVYPYPIPGPSCGPDKIKPIAWVVADKWVFWDKNRKNIPLPVTVSFVDACKSHDDCYGNCSGPNGTHGISKNDCDVRFRGAMKDECEDKLRLSGNRDVCITIANAYYQGVQRGGENAYNQSCNRAEGTSIINHVIIKDSIKNEKFHEKRYISN